MFIIRARPKTRRPLWKLRKPGYSPSLFDNQPGAGAIVLGEDTLASTGTTPPASFIDHASRVNTTNQTTTSASFVDATNSDIPSGSFTNGKKYLILAAAQLASSSTTVPVNLRVVHGSTAFADSEQGLTVIVADYRRSYFWWTVWTAVTGEDINFQFSADAGATASLNQIVLIAINLSDDLTENTDWFSDERPTDDALTTSLLTGASITIPPGTPGHDWLVLTNAQFTCTTNTRGAVSQITRSGEAASALPNVVMENRIANGLEQLSLVRPFTLGAAPNTFTESAAESGSAAAVTRLHSRVFALNLNKFKNHVIEYTESAIALSATDYATLAESLSITPDVTGDVWAGGYLSYDAKNVADYAKYRLQRANADEPAGQTTANYNFVHGGDVVDVAPFYIQAIPSLTAATAYTFDLDVSTQSVTNAPEAEARCMWAVTMELQDAPPITGVGAVTLGPDTVTSAGTVAIQAAAAIIEAANTLASTAAVAIAGAGAPTAGADTLAAAGAAGTIGDAAIQEAADTLLSAGEVAVGAAGAILKAADTLLAAGEVGISGQATIQEAASTLLSAGQAAIAGAGALLDAPTTAAGTGTVTSDITGAGTITLSPDTLASVAAAAIAGAASITELAAIITAAGKVFGPIQSVEHHVSGVNATTFAFPQPLTAGSMIHLAVVTFQSTAGTNITTPTDTLGHTYQPTAAQQNNTANTVHHRTWYVPGCSAGACTITVDISGPGLGEITAIASEWPGRDQVSPLSGTPSLFGPVTTTTPDTGNMTPSHDGSLLIAALHAGGVANTMTEEAGWNLLREYEGGSNTVTLSVVWKLQAVAAPDGASWTVTPNSICLAQVAAFRPAGTVGITGVAAIVLDPDVSASAASGGSRSRMLLLGVGG